MTTKADQIIDDDLLYKAFAAMKKRDFNQAEALLDKGLESARSKNDSSLEGVYHSAYGVLYKVQGEFKKAYKSYQQAERKIPDDHNIKIIVGHLLVEEFAQYDTAIRKMKKVLSSSSDLLIIHHALAVLGRASLLAGDKAEAKKCLDQLNGFDFSLFKSAAQIDFKFPELLAKKGAFADELLEYLKQAEKVALRCKEETYRNLIEGLGLLIQNLSSQ